MNSHGMTYGADMGQLVRQYGRYAKGEINYASVLQKTGHVEAASRVLNASSPATSKCLKVSRLIGWKPKPTRSRV